MNFDSTYFKQIDKSSQLPIYLVETIQISKLETPVKGKLTRVAKSEVYKFPYDKLISQKQVTITSQVKINSLVPEIRLPHLTKDAKQQWRLEAVGGSNLYKWSS